MHAPLGRDADEVVVVGAVVEGAEAEPVDHHRRAGLVPVGDDVRGVEQAELLEAADRALVGVRRDDLAAEADLVDPPAHLADGVAALDLVDDRHRLALVVGADHLPERHQHPALRRAVLRDQTGYPGRYQPAGSR